MEQLLNQLNDLASLLGGIITHDPFLLFFGCFYLVIGFSCFFAREAWQEFAALFVDNDALSLVMGIMILPVSLAIIVFYWNWETVGSNILMVVGFLGLIKALALLTKPSLIQNFVKKEFVRKWLWLDGVSGIAIGLGMLVL